MPTLAERQLAAWQRIAENWPVSHDAQHPVTEPDPDADVYGRDRSYRCGACEGGIALAVDGAGKRYLYTETQWMALVVLHLRNHHADLDPDLH
jgi:hypothetical protein